LVEISSKRRKKEGLGRRDWRKTYSFFSTRLARCSWGRYAGYTPVVVEKGRVERGRDMASGLISKEEYGRILYMASKGGVALVVRL